MIFLALILTQHHWALGKVAKARQQLFPNWAAKTNQWLLLVMNISLNTYLVLELFNLCGAITYLSVGKFGSMGTKYPVMLISVNRGVKYHVAISSAMLVRHTFHGITFCGSRKQPKYSAEIRNFKNACAKKPKSLINCQMLENVSLLALTDFARRSCKVCWTMTLVFSIFHCTISPIFARAMIIAFIYIYKGKKEKKRQASRSVAERLKFSLGKVKRKSRFITLWRF